MTLPSAADGEALGNEPPARQPTTGDATPNPTNTASTESTAGVADCLHDPIRAGVAHEDLGPSAAPASVDAASTSDRVSSERESRDDAAPDVLAEASPGQPPGSLGLGALARAGTPGTPASGDLGGEPAPAAGTFIIERVERIALDGGIEALEFAPGVNLLVGQPNTGKSVWMRFIDLLLGDVDPPSKTLKDDIVARYQGARMVLRIFPPAGVSVARPTSARRASAARHAEGETPNETPPLGPTPASCAAEQLPLVLPNDDQGADEESEELAAEGSEQDTARRESPEQHDDPSGEGGAGASAAHEGHSSGERVVLERFWAEERHAGKITVDGIEITAARFGEWLLQQLGIPNVHYPRGNPYGTRSWAQLTWRTMFRHIYREERFWSDLADKQPEGEQHAVLMQFLGLASQLFSVEYGDLVEKRREIAQLQAERDSYMTMLRRVTADIGRFSELDVTVTPEALAIARRRVHGERDAVIAERTAILDALRGASSAPADGRDAESDEGVGGERLRALSDDVVKTRRTLEQVTTRATQTADRISELQQYRASVQQELDRMRRAEAAGAALGDLRITHCPACDQMVDPRRSNHDHCHLCLQPQERRAEADDRGTQRLRLELEQLEVEVTELNEVIGRREVELGTLREEATTLREQLRGLDRALRPTRVAAAAILPPDLSILDQKAGMLDEQLRVLDSVAKALAQREVLLRRIDEIEAAAAQLEQDVAAQTRSLPLAERGTWLEDGLNTYLSVLGPAHWPEAPVVVTLRKRDFLLSIHGAEWSNRLGNTRACFFLHAYHYALLALSGRAGCNYPGLALIDFPATLANGLRLTDEENYLIEPFVSALTHRLPGRTQLIVAGRAFEGIAGANRLELADVY